MKSVIKQYCDALESVHSINGSDDEKSARCRGKAYEFLLKALSLEAYQLSVKQKELNDVIK